MAKGKKQKTGGKHRALPRHSHPTQSVDTFVHSRSHLTDESDYAPAASFSLRDAARKTSDRGRGFSSQVKLRHMAVDFVRASEGLKGTLEEAIDKTTLPDSDGSTDPSSATTRGHLPLQAPGSPKLSILACEKQLDCVDPELGCIARIANNKPSPRAPSPSPSNSSDEVVLFTGRQRPVAQSRPSPSASGKDALQSGEPSHQSTAEPSSSPADRSLATKPGTRIRAQMQGTKQSRPIERPHSSYETDSDAILADYMENLRAHGELEDDFVEKAQGSKISAELADLDDLGTSGEILDALEQIISKRERPSGVQFLVVWQGQTVDKAQWVSHESLTMNGAAEVIAQYEEEQATSDDKERDDVLSLDVSSGSSDDDDNSDAEYDEDERIARRIERMTDEQIARLLAKQEELGMGSEELLLFDDLGDDQPALQQSDSGLESIEEFLSIRPQSKGSRRGKSRRTHNNRLGTWGDDDELFGGVSGYGDFDPMDFDRPSLARKGSKARKTAPTFDVSDSEIESTLRSQWEADRDKKKARKQEREELRAQGLLGLKSGQRPKLFARYQNGLSSEDIMLELEDFLLSPFESRSFPPMDKQSRKALHEVAAKFNLKSKSVGSGKKRYPVLYRTRKTLPFDEALFTRATRRFFPRMDTAGRGAKKIRGSGRGGGGGISYMEGDAVGASAPEIGIENRGRAMLEKMGWSKGMSLGSLGSQGITEPIAHIVKKSRAGLG